MNAWSLAYVVDGYTRWGSFERCAEVAHAVEAAFGAPAAGPRPRGSELSDDALFTALFFAARAARHAGSQMEAQQWSDNVVEELRRRLGDAKLQQLAAGPDGFAFRLTDEAQNAATGAMLGAACGDAAGAVLEFLGRAPTQAEVDHALTMPGGGCWGVAPGQVTDDSELMLALAEGLLVAGGYDAEDVARRYVDWMTSVPFDVGHTTRTAFSTPALGDGTLASRMRRAAQASLGSKANGSLMRASPLAVLGHALPDESLADLARQDSTLSHPNRVCVDAVSAYILAQAHLIAQPGDRQGALDRADRWCGAAGDPEVRAWMTDARAGKLPAFHPLAGFVRIGFTAAFFHLRSGSSYVDALHATLVGGGDTDTNACIVGGLVGAAVGATGIPERMRSAVLECDTARGRPRPGWLHPRRIPGLVQALGWCGSRGAVRTDSGRQGHDGEG